MSIVLRIGYLIGPWLTLLILAFITYVSLYPLPKLSVPDFKLIDKIGHLIAYMAAAIPIAFSGRPRWPIWIAAILAWSGVMELVQPYVNRHGEWGDFIVNAMGLVLGTAIARAAHRLIARA